MRNKIDIKEAVKKFLEILIRMCIALMYLCVALWIIGMMVGESGEIFMKIGTVTTLITITVSIIKDL